MKMGLLYIRLGKLFVLEAPNFPGQVLCGAGEPFLDTRSAHGVRSSDTCLPMTSFSIMASSWSLDALFASVLLR